jgi:hypothetical protein
MVLVVSFCCGCCTAPSGLSMAALCQCADGGLQVSSCVTSVAGVWCEVVCEAEIPEGETEAAAGAEASNHSLASANDSSQQSVAGSS